MRSRRLSNSVKSLVVEPERMSSNASMEEMKCFLEDGRRRVFLSQEVKENCAHDSFTSQGAATKLRRTKSNFEECVAATVEKMDRRFLEQAKTNNQQRIVELAISCETSAVVYQDEKQNENPEHLLVMPCFLNTSSNLLVVFDDGQPETPFLPGVLRSCTKKLGASQPVKTIPLRDLHMRNATPLYRPLMQKTDSVQTWLFALCSLLTSRQRLAGDLPKYLTYERDKESVQETLQINAYRIAMVPEQSAIGTDLDYAIVLNGVDNQFFRTPFRNNVEDTMQDAVHLESSVGVMWPQYLQRREPLMKQTS